MELLWFLVSGFFLFQLQITEILVRGMASYFTICSNIVAVAV